MERGTLVSTKTIVSEFWPQILQANSKTVLDSNDEEKTS